MNNKLFLSILSVFLVFLTVYIGVLIITGIEKEEERTIVVSAEGEAFAKPDIAIITISVKSEERTVDRAMLENTEKANKVIEFLKEEGIEERDIKTASFNIYPRYRYDDRSRNLEGYEVLHSLEVKIRDIFETGKIIEGATAKGANEVSGLSFLVEDEEELKAIAREDAINKAKARAEMIASQLGVRIRRIISFSETEYQPFYRGVASLEYDSAPDI